MGNSSNAGPSRLMRRNMVPGEFRSDRKWHGRTGDQFGRLRVLGFYVTDNPATGRLCLRGVEVICVCGWVGQVAENNLRSGRTTRCDSCAKRASADANTKWAHYFPDRSVRNAWVNRYCAMVSRCHTPTSSGWQNYGGRGIGVCRQWLVNRETFFQWVSAIPEHTDLSLELDRRNNDGWYSPENCHLVTRSANASNRRVCRYVEYLGRFYTTAAFTDIRTSYRSPSTVRRLLASGLTPEQIVERSRTAAKGPYLRSRQRRAAQSVHGPDVSRPPGGA